jgi:hypothetical protein
LVVDRSILDESSKDEQKRFETKNQADLNRE